MPTKGSLYPGLMMTEKVMEAAACAEAGRERQRSASRLMMETLHR